MKYYCKTILFIFTVLVLSAFGFAGSAQATTKYAVNAGGVWSADGTWSTVSAKNASRVANTVAPTSNDDVVLDDYSGNVSFTSAATTYARSVDMVVNGNYAGTLTGGVGALLNLGTTTECPGDIQLRFLPGKYSASTTAEIRFISSYITTPQTIDFAGNDTGNTTFGLSGTAGNYKLTGTWGTNAVNPAMAVTLTKGTLDTNGQTCYWGKFDGGNSSTKSLILGTSQIHLLATSYAWVLYYAGTTLSAASSSLLFDATSYHATQLLFYPILGTYGTLTFTGSGVVRFGGTDMPVVGTLSRIGTAVKTDGIVFPANMTITGELKIQGNSAINRILVYADTLGTPRTLTVTGATISNCQNVDFRDITFVGSPNFASIIGGSGNAGGNSGATFTPSTDWYWHNTTTYATNTYRWSEYSNWYTATNGTGNQMPSTRVPLPQDNTYFDNNSVSGTTTINQDMPRMGKTLDFSKGTGVAAMTFDVSVLDQTLYGSLNLVSNVTVTKGLTNLTFEGRGAFNITSAGKQFYKMTIQMVGGTLTQLDALSCSSNFALRNGTFDASTFGLSVLQFLNDGTFARTLKMGSGTWTITATTALTSWGMGTITGLTNPTTMGETSTISFGYSGANAQTFAGGGCTYNNISIVGGGTQVVTITGSNTFNNFTINAPKTVKFTAGTTQIINGTFSATGTSGNLITMDTDTGAGTFTIKKPIGKISGNWLSLMRSTAVCGAGCYAGANSTPDASNSGWIFQASPLTNTYLRIKSALLRIKSNLLRIKIR